MTNDVTLAAGLNRGLFVEEGACVTKQGLPGGARVSVSDGVTLTVRWPVTVSVTNAFPVTLWKEGAGTLALGGALGFLTEGGVSGELPANAPKPVLSVTNGFVRALSAGCLDGFTVVFAPTSKTVATGLRLDLDTDEAALRRYGIRNAKTDVPFGAGPIRIDVTGVPKMTRAGGTFGVLTVRTSVADDVASRLSVAWPEAEGLTCRFVRHADAAAGTTTFALDYRGARIVNEKPGFVLVLRGGTGEPGTVKASSFGFDPADSTAFLQRAFDSGARKVIIDRQASDWVTRPLFITNSNVEVVLEEGVVLRAKRGEFHGTGDCLLRITGGATNVVLRGRRWAALAMNKADYMDPAQKYSFGEWRHALSVLSAADVTVRNLAILSSGGDGIYVNGARNVLLEDLVCHDHYRQGMSPISVDGLTVRRCAFDGTRGTPPQSGIDMEPNADNQRFAGVLYEDCSFNGNAAHGIDIYLGNFSAKTRPLSITFRRCVAKGNGACGFTFMAGSPATVQESGSVGGFVRFEDCRFEQNGNEAFKLMNHTAAGVEVSFGNCRFDARGSKAEAAIALSNSQLPLDFGGVRFDGCEALVDANRQAMTFEAPRGIGIAGRLEGTLDVVCDGARSRFDLTAFAAANAPHPELVTHFRSASVDFRKIEPVSAGAPLKGTFTPSIRNAFVYVQTVPAAGKYAVSFRSSSLRGGDASVVCGVVQLLDRAGTDLGSFEIPQGDFAYVLRANGPNVYRFEVSPRNSGVIAVGSATPGGALLMDRPVRFFHASGAKFHFHMPAGAREALVDVSPEEAAAVSVLDAAGNVLDAMPLQTAGMVLKGIKGGAGDEVWTLQLDRLVEDCGIQLGGDAVPLGSTEREGVIRN